MQDLPHDDETLSKGRLEIRSKVKLFSKKKQKGLLNTNSENGTLIDTRVRCQKKLIKKAKNKGLLKKYVNVSRVYEVNASFLILTIFIMIQKNT